jgi:UDPglucose 6-dehydrogenase
MKTSFGIVGYGVVGKATHKSLFPNDTPFVHDIKLHTDLNELKNCNVVFFCIPTDTEQDIVNLINNIKELKALNNAALVVVRCTVPIGTCNQIQHEVGDEIIYLPEFLRDRCWEEDCLRRPLVVGVDSLKVPEFLIDQEFELCSLKEAETVKMFSNNLAALRITFANHFFDLCQKTNSDYNTVLDLYSKTCHSQSYLEANSDLRGFGGKCLTKDLEFLIETFSKLQLSETLFTSIKKDNEAWPMTVRTS